MNKNELAEKILKTLDEKLNQARAPYLNRRIDAPKNFYRALNIHLGEDHEAESYVGSISSFEGYTHSRNVLLVRWGTSTPCRFSLSLLPDTVNTYEAILADILVKPSGFWISEQVVDRYKALTQTRR